MLRLRRLRPASAFAAALPVAALLAACGTDSEPGPTVRIKSPAMNDTVAGPNVFVKVATTRFKFSAAAKVSAATHGDDVTGHIHLFLDKPAGLDADAIEQLSKADTVTLADVAPGKHYLIAQGAEAGHDDVDGMIDSVAFTVKSP